MQNRRPRIVHAWKHLQIGEEMLVCDSYNRLKNLASRYRQKYGRWFEITKEGAVCRVRREK
jgi:hypothetical protein